MHATARCLLILSVFIAFFKGAAGQVTADFSASVTTGCSPLIVNFTNKSTGATSYLWDFGNGNTSTNTNPGAIYVNGGNFTVTLIAKDASGNTDTLTKTGYISVHPNPLAGFKTNKSGGCVPTTINFTDTSVSGGAAIVSWKWDFGDGTISNSQNPSHSFTSAGTYSITLSVTDANGCKNTIVRSNYITEVTAPVARFFSDKRISCQNKLVVSFSDASLNTVAGKTKYKWYFGDGDTSSQQNPVHTYSGYGDYNVALKVTVNGICSDSEMFTGYITLKNFTYNFSADKTKGCGLFEINFTNLTSPDPYLLNYTWDFGDGTTSNQLNPTHVYLDTGKYTVKLYATSGYDGCHDTVIKTNYISIGTAPVADFITTSGVISCKAPFTVSFKDQSVRAASWEWDFGDGGTSTLQNPNHTYTTTGNFTVRLIAKTAEGCPDTAIQLGLVTVSPPKSGFYSTMPEGCKDDNLIQFIDSTNSVTPVVSRTWYFGDGDSSTEINPVHTYADTGKYSVTLVVTTSGGCKNSLTRVSYVKIGLKPTASFTASPQDSCIQYMTVTFTNNSASFTPKPDLYIWDFGDGQSVRTTSSTGPVHFYNDDPGSYTPVLVVFSNGCSDTLTRTDYITVHGPKAKFSSFQSPCYEDSTYFFNGTLGANKYLWSFGDASTSSEQNPVHKYSSPGNYSVKLQAWDTIMGCVNDTTIKVSVPDFSTAQPGFSASTTSGCYPITVTFTDTTRGGVSHSWDFGNGRTDSGAVVTNTYSEPGYYTVKLTVVNGSQCSKTVTRQNYIRAYGVKPSFDICSPQECGTGSVRFFDMTVSPDPIKKRTWTFGNSETLTTTDTIVDHLYSSIPLNQYDGYTVKLVVQDSAGCKDSATAKIRLTKPSPLHFKWYSKICGGYAYSFSATAGSSNGVGPFTYYWDFGDGLNPGSSYSRIFTTDGTYPYKLYYEDYYGCKDTIKDTIVIKITKPKPGFIVDDTFSSCPPLQVQFTDTTVVGDAAISNWTWTFGDGATSKIQNPKHLYAVPGYYTVKMVILDAAGCSDSVTKTKLIHIKGPTGTYSFSPTMGCYSLTVHFTSSSSNASSLSWDLGDGTIVKDTAFSHTYSMPGTYVPRLILSDTLGCTYTAPPFDTVHVWPGETAGMDADDSTICDTGIVKFFDRTVYSSKVVSRLWDFGDGYTSTDSNPVHYYHGYDTFTVKLSVLDSTGCTDSITRSKWIAVTDQLKPAFGTSSTNTCQQEEVTFIDSSTAIKSTVINRRWWFGDGDSSDADTPVHIYSSSGIYRARLRIVSDASCTDTISKLIVIHNRPQAGFTFNDVCAADSASFTDTSKDGSGSIASWLWDFGDSTVTSSLQNPRHKYSADGSYPVTLVVTSSLGCHDTARNTITIFTQPKAAFISASECLNVPMRFFDQSTVTGDSIVSWLWNFDDGSTSSIQNPTHLFATDGNHNVTLRVTTSHGCRDSLTRSYNVYPFPNADFTSTSPCLIDSVSFFDSSSIKTNNLEKWYWDFGDGSFSSLQNPKHLYATADTFNVSLVATSHYGCSDTVTKQVIVHPMPVADFSFTTECFRNATAFRNLSSVSSGSLSYSWNFGDGGSSTAADPSHFFTAGSYDVVLKISTAFGCMDSVKKTVTIYPKPKAVFAATTECFPAPIRFTDSSWVSSGSVVSWNWDFGDASTSGDTSPVHTYASAGTYLVTLIVSTDKGCRDTVKHNIIIHPKPVTGFNASNVCQAENANFINKTTLSTGNIQRWRWDFGDGDTSSAKDPVHHYNSAGKYAVTLFAESEFGCSDTLTDSITVFPQPRVSFTGSNTCPDDPIKFNNGSSVSTGTITSYLWNFGDGTTSTDAEPSHYYKNDGTFMVTLKATTDNGCIDSANRSFTVYPKPKSGFSFSNVCRVDSVVFVESSSVKSGSIVSWSWDFGDGQSSLLQNPKHLYNSSGVFDVSLIVKTDKGCGDTLVQQITIYPMPKAGFTNTTECYPNGTVFTDTSTVSSGNLSYLWKFGDGKTSTLKNPVHFYDTAGTYTVNLFVTTNHSCRDSFSQKIIIHPKPKAKLSATTECLTHQTIFTDSSTVSKGSVTGWNWDFDDGSNSTLQNPKHVYTVEGTYNVRLIATTDKGCSDTVTVPVLVYPVPRPDFTYSDVCLTDPAGFTNKSKISTGVIAGFQWYFGDGDSSGLQSPVHKYRSPGNYSVTLIAYTDKQCRDTIVKTITVFPLPKPVFTAAEVCLYDSMTFDSRSSSISSGSITAYSWDFGDGQSSGLPNPKHKYTSDGYYSVRLILTSDHGCVDTLIKTVTVNPIPKADFTTANVCLVNSASFTDASTVKKGSVTGWNWDFGDGSGSFTQNPSHTFASAGRYDVRLVVTTAKGCRDTIVKKITIYPMPKAQFSHTTECYINVTGFKDESTISTGSLVSWKWDFGDGTGSTQQNPGHIYKSAGTYTVKLVVTSGFGCSDSVSNPVTVYPKPKASFTATTECYANPTVFKDASTVSSGTVTAWNWTFGDGGTSTLQNPNHKYQAGTYTSRLIVTTDKGCKDTVTQTIIVHPKPQSKFTFSNSCLSEPVTFTNISSVATGNIISSSWDFGDGALSSLASPQHKYSAPGTYTVTLKSTTDKGCIDTVQKQVIIYPLPKSGFSLQNTCRNQPAPFTDQSTISSGLISAWDWNFGDGSVSTQKNPSHIYTADGTYKVRLIVTSGFGCRDTLSKDIIIYPLPKADFSFTTECVYDSVRFADKSAITSGTLSGWNWNFGDGFSASGSSVKHLYGNDGTYKVRLVTTSSFGCVDTVYKQVTVLPKPKVNWTAPDICLNEPTVFNDATTINPPGNLKSWSWSFGDGTTSTLRNTFHYYKNPGSYNVKLVVISDKGCKDSLTKAVTVYPLPVAAWSAEPVCQKEPTKFTDQSTILSGSIVKWAWVFGDGAMSLLQNPEHIYPAPGNYRVQLIIYSEFGCTDTSYDSVTVWPRTVPGFKADEICFGGITHFYDKTTISNGKVDSWAWDFGDGDNSGAVQNPVHTYAKPGTYKVKLITTSDKGCADTFFNKAIVHELPKAAFTTGNLCWKQAVPFIDQSVSNDGKIVKWIWKFGDGSASVDSMPKHNYVNKGLYYVRLQVWTKYGCTDSFGKYIKVVDMTPDFVLSDTIGCLNKGILFTDKTVSDTPLVSWKWDFGDGQSATTQNPVHAFGKPGKYIITLTVTNLGGCTRIITRPQPFEVMDAIPPTPAPLYRVSVENDKTVSIAWPPYKGSDFAKYVILRDGPSGSYMIYSTPKRYDTVYNEGGLNTLNQSYCYKIALMDICGNVSSPDSSRTHCTIDIHAQSGLNKVSVFWNRYQGWDSVLRYELYREDVNLPGKWYHIANVRGGKTTYDDTDLICRRTLHYKVKAVQYKGFDQYSWSDTAAAAPVYIPNVLSNEIIRATVENDRYIKVEWTASKTKRPWNYILQKSTDNINYSTVGIYDRNTFSANDYAVHVDDTSYYYRMIVQDSCGDMSTWNNIGKTILLKLDTVVSADHPGLYWTRYHEWPKDVDRYDIEWFENSSGTWKAVGSVTPSDTQFIDDKTFVNQPEYCYRIKAFSRADHSIVSISNEQCIKTIMKVYIPNSFTPNGDELNDGFGAKGIFMFDYDLKIYNRWGELLFESTDPKVEWNGTFEGRPCQMDVYIYRLIVHGSGTQKFIKSGNVTLLR